MAYLILHLDNPDVPLAEKRTYAEAEQFIRRRFPRARRVAYEPGKYATFNRTGRSTTRNWMELYSIVEVE